VFCSRPGRRHHYITLSLPLGCVDAAAELVEVFLAGDMTVSSDQSGTMLTTSAAAAADDDDDAGADNLLLTFISQSSPSVSCCCAEMETETRPMRDCVELTKAR